METLTEAISTAYFVSHYPSTILRNDTPISLEPLEISLLEYSISPEWLWALAWIVTVPQILTEYKRGLLEQKAQFEALSGTFDCTADWVGFKGDQ